MRIHLIAVGDRVPGWVEQGYAEYARRLPPECALELVEIAPGRRTKGADLSRTLQDECARMQAAIPKQSRVLALDVQGRQWSTAELARQLEGWLRNGCDLALLVGGPDGLAPACRARADLAWSLSRLTLPHAVVRVVVAEQIYRAWSILARHPYHR